MPDKKQIVNSTSKKERGKKKGESAQNGSNYRYYSERLEGLLLSFSLLFLCTDSRVLTDGLHRQFYTLSWAKSRQQEVTSITGARHNATTETTDAHRHLLSWSHRQSIKESADISGHACNFLWLNNASSTNITSERESYQSISRLFCLSVAVTKRLSESADHLWPQQHHKLEQLCLLCSFWHQSWAELTKDSECRQLTSTTHLCTWYNYWFSTCRYFTDIKSNWLNTWKLYFWNTILNISVHNSNQ